MAFNKQAGRWSAEDDANLKVMLKQGLSKCQIARSLGRPESSVYTRAEFLANSDTKPRNCMCCGKEFKSQHSMNRLCPYCNNRAKDTSPYAH